ncbi:MAG TPA: hypothetical protein VNF71_02280 [Acidimicrobiales bacterium]|nr:hypothetical protein [Acidimicrobiales bacterium]
MSLLELPEAQSLRLLTADGRLLFATRVVRTFSHGLLSVVLVLYLAAIGLPEGEIGMLLTATLVGDAWSPSRSPRTPTNSGAAACSSSARCWSPSPGSPSQYPGTCSS